LRLGRARERAGTAVGARTRRAGRAVRLRARAAPRRRSRDDEQHQDEREPATQRHGEGVLRASALGASSAPGGYARRAPRAVLSALTFRSAAAIAAPTSAPVVA